MSTATYQDIQEFFPCTIIVKNNLAAYHCITMFSKEEELLNDKIYFVNKKIDCRDHEHNTTCKDLHPDLFSMNIKNDKKFSIWHGFSFFYS